MRRAALLFALVFGVAAALALSTMADHASEWSEVARKNGVVVEHRSVPDRTLPSLRATAEVEAGIWDVFAVIYDVSRHAEWMDRCVEARWLERTRPERAIVYNRTRSGWPVADRDAVLETRVRVERGAREIQLDFGPIVFPAQGPVKGVVRMPLLAGHYRLRWLGPQRTHVEHRLDLDLGGRLPRWVARIATRDIPLNTLLNLREQVARTRGQYPVLLGQWRGDAREP